MECSLNPDMLYLDALTIPRQNLEELKKKKKNQHWVLICLSQTPKCFKQLWTISRESKFKDGFSDVSEVPRVDAVEQSATLKFHMLDMKPVEVTFHSENLEAPRLTLKSASYVWN